jgi:hypothetical protein
MVKGIESIVTKDDISNISGEFAGLIQHIRKCNNDIIKWMFFFTVTQTIATSTIFYLMLHR